MVRVQVQVGLHTNIAVTGGSVTHTLRGCSVIVRNPAGEGRSGIKKKHYYTTAGL